MASINKGDRSVAIRDANGGEGFLIQCYDSPGDELSIHTIGDSRHYTVVYDITPKQARRLAKELERLADRSEGKA